MPTYSIRVHPDRIRTIEDPNFPNMKTVYALVNVLDIPVGQADGKRKILLSLGPDPRVPKTDEDGKPIGVAKEISKSLASWDGAFHLLNRGITVSAEAADYDNQTKLLKLVVPDDDRYGILDGGHTTYSIEAVLQKDWPQTDSKREQFVRLEILIGAEDYLVEIARARNTSKQVQQFSLKHKAGEFEWLKKAIHPHDIKVRWSENDPQEFPVLELIQILAACNPIQFESNNHPIEAYKNAGKCLEYLLDPGDRHGYRHLAPVAKDIGLLYDTIRNKWWGFYNQPHPVTGKRGHARARTEARDRKRGKANLMRYLILDVKADPANDQHVEKGLAIPALAGFRALLEKGADGNLAWRTNPFEFFDKHGVLLVKTVMDASESHDNNPHTVGRDATVYDLVYRTIESELTKVENERLREQLAEHEAARA